MCTYAPAQYERAFAEDIWSSAYKTAIVLGLNTVQPMTIVLIDQGTLVLKTVCPNMPSKVLSFEGSQKADLSWLPNVLSGSRERSSSKEMMAAVSGLNKLLAQEDFETLSWLFEIINPHTLSPEMGITFAQTTFASRDSISTWRGFAAGLEKTFADRKIDKANLIGLIEDAATGQ